MAAVVEPGPGRGPKWTWRLQRRRLVAADIALALLLDLAQHVTGHRELPPGGTAGPVTGEDGQHYLVNSWAINGCGGRAYVTVEVVLHGGWPWRRHVTQSATVIRARPAWASLDRRTRL